MKALEFALSPQGWELGLTKTPALVPEETDTCAYVSHHHRVRVQWEIRIICKALQMKHKNLKKKIDEFYTISGRANLVKHNKEGRNHKGKDK